MIFEDIQGRVKRSITSAGRMQPGSYQGAPDNQDAAAAAVRAIRRSRSRRRRRYVLLVGVAAMLLLAAASYWMWAAKHHGGQTAEETSKADRLAQTIEDVGKLYVLPVNEEPTVAEISNKSKLPGNQMFFENAQNGDMLIVYTKTQIALLYRPSIHKLVNVAPVTLPPSTGQ